MFLLYNLDLNNKNVVHNNLEYILNDCYISTLYKKDPIIWPSTVKDLKTFLSMQVQPNAYSSDTFSSTANFKFGNFKFSVKA